MKNTQNATHFIRIHLYIKEKTNMECGVGEYEPAIKNQTKRKMKRRSWHRVMMDKCYKQRMQGISLTQFSHLEQFEKKKSN